jgi:hypothetical protein
MIWWDGDGVEVVLNGGEGEEIEKLNENEFILIIYKYLCDGMVIWLYLMFKIIDLVDRDGFSEMLGGLWIMDG